ncbi:arginyl-tRNA-protein transferase [Pseudomonas aeruginosa]|nr:arginyl-tRNA-protein transferase [Pseudomonas aeruginosa]
MTELARLKFYATQPHPCSYLPEEQATTLFLDPSQPMDTQLYASLSEVGFRRSGDHLYRPHCQHCTACIAARIPVADFSPNRQQRRILKRNAELQVIRKRPSFNEEYYDLYRRYIEQRHADGDMYPAQPRPVRHLPGPRLALLLLLRVPPAWPPAGHSRDGRAAERTSRPSIPSTIPTKSSAAWDATRSSGRSPRPNAWACRPSTWATGSRIAAR